MGRVKRLNEKDRQAIWDMHVDTMFFGEGRIQVDSKGVKHIPAKDIFKDKSHGFFNNDEFNELGELIKPSLNTQGKATASVGEQHEERRNSD